LSTLRFEVLDLVRFVQNYVIPSFPLKRFLILYHEFITGDAHIAEIQIRPSLFTLNKI
jgi:hypothetical protein